MADTVAPYLPHQPGDLITAEDWNDMQIDVKNDIATQTAAAVAKVKDVDHATNADKVGGLSVDDLTKAILDQVYQQLPKRTGYMQVFLNLAVGQDRVVQHNLQTFPLVDLYQLGYFPMVCAKGERAEDVLGEWGMLYVHHEEEKRLRLPGNTTPIDIETTTGPNFRVPWMSLIDQFKEQKLLDYTDDTTLDELEVSFWQAMFHSPPNDAFDPDTYCHSPWFEKCCGEKRSVGELRKRGDLPRIYLKMKPEKTVNSFTVTDTAPPLQISPAQEPSNVRVSQLDLNTVALRLLSKPVPPLIPPPGLVVPPSPPMLPPPDAAKTFLPLMMLLKV
jgi:hypothetical protein